MPTVNVSLPAELAEFIAQEVASGDYPSASDVVRDGLRLLQRDRELQAEKLAILRREVGLALEQVEAGELSTMSVADILAELEAEDPPEA